MLYDRGTNMSATIEKFVLASSTLIKYPEKSRAVVHDEREQKVTSGRQLHLGV
jgi:hypothetical protein